MLVRDTKPDYVFHMASYVSGRQDVAALLGSLSGNLVAAVNLMTAIHERGGAKSVVIAGSSEEPRQFSLAEPESAPYSPYAASKLAASGYAAFFRRTLGLPIGHARIFMGYGPRQLDLKKLVPYVTLELLQGRTPQLSSGKRLADFTYIDDIVSGVLALGLRPDVVSLEIGSGVLTSVGEIAARLRDIIDPALSIALGATPDRLNEPRHVANVAQSKALVGWQPEVSLEDGLRRTVAWYRNTLPTLVDIA